MEYKNYLGTTLVANQVFTTKFTKGVEKLYKQNSEYFIKGEGVEGKLFPNKELKTNYLILKREGFYEIFSEPSRSNPFYYEKDKLNQDGNSEIYSNFIGMVTPSKSIIELNNQKLERRLQVYKDDGFDGESLAVMRQMVVRFMNFKEPMFCSSAFQIRNFLHYLEKNEASKPFNLEVLAQNPQHFKEVDKRIEEFGIIIDLLQTVTKEHGFISKNKFSFNDLDNHLWKQGNFTLLKDQNLTFAIEFEDKKNFTIYGATHDAKAKKNATANKLLTDFRSGNTDPIDNIALKVVNGKTQYSDNALMYSLDFDLTHTKEVILEERLGKIEYPVDIRDFDYQLAYCTQYYGYGKDQFLMHALFVLGNGYSYDSKTGRIYAQVNYDTEVVEKIGKIQEEASQPFTSLVYLWPKEGMKKLDAKWTEALEYIVNKIKTDQPDMSDTSVPHGKTPKQVLKDLEGVISYNKNATAKLKMK